MGGRYPDGVATANDVLRAAEEWADAREARYALERALDTGGPVTWPAFRAAVERHHVAVVELAVAVTAYRATATREQPVIAKEAGD